MQGRSVALLAGVPGILGSPALHELAELGADDLERLDELGVGLPRRGAEDLDDADEAALAAHGEADGGVQAGGRRRGPPGQAVIGRCVR